MLLQLVLRTKTGLTELMIILFGKKKFFLLSLFFLSACGGSGGGSTDNNTGDMANDEDVIEVQAPDLSDLADQMLVRNQALEPLEFNNTGGAGLESCEAADLPDGLDIAVNTAGTSCEISGTPTTTQLSTAYVVEAVNTSGSSQASVNIEVVFAENLSDLDIELLALLESQPVTGNPAQGRDIPDINEALPDLGKALFFAKNLGGQQDAACVSCHHPSLGGGDNLSLSVGVDAVNQADELSPDLLGMGRFHSSNLPLVPRNAPTIFNIALWDTGLFWDSRIQSVDGDNAAQSAMGTASGIITPDSSDSSTADALLPAGVNLANAQSRFPVTSDAEMRGTFEAASDNQSLRASLATRFDDDSTSWSELFEAAYGDDDVNFDRIAEAIAAYENSLVFVDNPWNQYLAGDVDALSNQQKQGAILFFTSEDDNGGGCAICHSGDLFSDEQHHVIGFPQIGPGKGNDTTGDNDFGRENITGDEGDRYHFRTPTLLNVTVTAPYGHAGTYLSLDEVLDHYNNPRGAANDFFGANVGAPGASFDGTGDFCDLPQIDDIIAKTGNTCSQIFDALNPNAFENTDGALDLIGNNAANSSVPDINLNAQERDQIVAFLEALTDPCVENRICLAPWIIDASNSGDYPDSFPLIAVDENGLDL